MKYLIPVLCAVALLAGCAKPVDVDQSLALMEDPVEGAVYHSVTILILTLLVGLFLVVRAMQLSDMKEKLRIFGLLVAAHIGGVLLGTAASGLLFDMPLGKGGYLWGIILAPWAMTMEIPMVFHSSVSVGRFVVAGLFISVACFAWGMIKYSSWALCGLFLGSILWSLGNILVFWTLMSV